MPRRRRSAFTIGSSGFRALSSHSIPTLAAFAGVDGKVAPYDVYDLHANDAWVTPGLSHDTAEFAVATIRTWWREMSVAKYPHATSLVITADGGGSNGYRVRFWKLERQGLVDELGFPMTCAICHQGRASGTRSSTACSR